MNSQTKVEALIEVLRFYASEDQYKGFHWPIGDDRGVRARLAIAMRGTDEDIIAAGLEASRP